MYSNRGRVLPRRTATGKISILAGSTCRVSSTFQDLRLSLTAIAVPLQSLVASAQLSIPPGSKSGLLGFYDCALSEKKRLYCKYLFKGRLHEFTVDDSAGVAAPMRGQSRDSISATRRLYFGCSSLDRVVSSSVRVYASLLEY